MPYPYSVLDHRQVNVEYGSMDDFRELLEEIRRRGMKCVLDVVIDSLCRASELHREHPEFFCSDREKLPESADETETLSLDYGNRDVWAYQLKTLVMWAELADGFCCVSAADGSVGVLGAGAAGNQRVKARFYLDFRNAGFFLSGSLYCR